MSYIDLLKEDSAKVEKPTAEDANVQKNKVTQVKLNIPPASPRKKTEAEQLAEYALLIEDVLGDKETIGSEQDFKDFNEKASILMTYWKKHNKAN